jgi:hypothetical protein
MNPCAWTTPQLLFYAAVLVALSFAVGYGVAMDKAHRMLRRWIDDDDRIARAAGGKLEPTDQVFGVLLELTVAAERSVPYMAEHVAQNLDGGPGDRVAHDMLEEAARNARAILVDLEERGEVCHV